MSAVKTVKLLIDPPSYHFLGDKLFNVDTARFCGDNVNTPYAYLRDYLASRGVEVHTADYLSDRPNGDCHVYVSMGMLDNYRSLAQREDVILSAFFAMECPIVEPSLYRELNEAQHHFHRIYSWSDSASLERFVGGPLLCRSFQWPQAFADVHAPIWSQTDRKFLVIINKNKLPRVYWQELYTERLRAIEYFARTDEIDLFGVGWDVPPYRVGKTWLPYTLQRAHRSLLHYWHTFHPDPLLQAARRCYRGVAESKAETLGNYTFAVCFENMVLKGWITEKIFDCFYAGAIPVYWGAPDIEDYVPAECFIDMRQFKGYEDLRRYLKSLDENAI